MSLLRLNLLTIGSDDVYGWSIITQAFAMCKIIWAAIRVMRAITKGVTIAQSAENLYAAWILSAVATIHSGILGLTVFSRNVPIGTWPSWRQSCYSRRRKSKEEYAEQHCC